MLLMLLLPLVSNVLLLVLWLGPRLSFSPHQLPSQLGVLAAFSPKTLTSEHETDGKVTRHCDDVPADLMPLVGPGL